MNEETASHTPDPKTKFSIRTFAVFARSHAMYVWAFGEAHVDEQSSFSGRRVCLTTSSLCVHVERKMLPRLALVMRPKELWNGTSSVHRNARRRITIYVLKIWKVHNFHLIASYRTGRNVHKKKIRVEEIRRKKDGAERACTSEPECNISCAATSLSLPASLVLVLFAVFTQTETSYFLQLEMFILQKKKKKLENFYYWTREEEKKASRVSIGAEDRTERMP